MVKAVTKPPKVDKVAWAKTFADAPLNVRRVKACDALDNLTELMLDLRDQDDDGRRRIFARFRGGGEAVGAYYGALIQALGVTELREDLDWSYYVCLPFGSTQERTT